MPRASAASERDAGGWRTLPKSVWLAVLVAALGYFVDIYDLVLFAILRKPSLESFGLFGEANASAGRVLLNLQLTGMIVGGIVWGMLGDRKGRLSVLFGSIVLYSVANLLNAFVPDTTTYGVLRFIAGFGLAGELGAGITLVSEILPGRIRGIGTTIVATVGLAGAVTAGLVGEALVTAFPMHGWRVAYGIGGVLGLALLALRVGLLESGLYRGAMGAGVSRGNVLMLLWPAERFGRFLRVILIGMPIWFAGGVLFVFAPEIGLALGLPEPPTGGHTIVFAYSGVVLGDLAAGLISQAFRRRRLVIGLFLGAYALAIGALIGFGGTSIAAFYALMFLVGATTGYWVLFVTVASEQFGTNLRATVTTSAPNFVRGTAVPVVEAWFLLKAHSTLGVPISTLAVGLVCIAVGAVALAFTRETFHVDLDFLER
jgi:MFS family permease